MSTTPSVLPAQGRLIDKTFTFPVRVYYEDTDAGGIVYYANYLKFAERARSEFLRFLDIDQQHILAQKHSVSLCARAPLIICHQPNWTMR